MAKKTWKIPAVWQEWGILSIEANTVEEAIQKAYDGGLPDGNYIDDSFEVDREGVENQNKIKLKKNKTLICEWCTWETDHTGKGFGGEGYKVGDECPRCEKGRLQRKEN